MDNAEAITARAVQFAKDNCKEITRRAIAGFSQESDPVSIFMAGSPGAGKTEASKKLLKNHGDILRIDADELREHFRECGYDGKNSHLFQKAATRLVHEIHDAALKSRISFLLDGTFAGESMARQNIERSLKRDRDVFVLFVYQSPLIAWNFVQKHEKVEGRRIQPQDFAEKFCASREVVNKMKAEFGNKIELSLVQKNIDGTNKIFKESIQRIDDHISEKYTEDQILAEIEKSESRNGKESGYAGRHIPLDCPEQAGQ